MTDFESANEIAARYDGRSADYDQSAMHRALAQVVADFVDRSDVTDVLDIGTGTALVLRALAARLGPDIRLNGIDLSPKMLTAARSALPQAEFSLQDAADLTFSDASFDLVTCVTAIHLMPKPKAALREWKRVLRPGGKIVVATFRDDELSHGALVSIADIAESTALSITREMNWEEDPAARSVSHLVIFELTMGG